MRIRDLSFSFGKQSNLSEIKPQNIETQTQSANSDVVRTAQSTGRNDAVVLQGSLRKGNAEGGVDSERQSKVDAIRQQVKDGSYKADREGVAVALIRDLGL